MNNIFVKKILAKVLTKFLVGKFGINPNIDIKDLEMITDDNGETMMAVNATVTVPNNDLQKVINMI